MDLIELARKLRPYIEKGVMSLSDEDAIEAVQLFPAWSDGVVYTTADRIRYGGELYKVLQPHTSQATWTPDAAVSLYAKVLAGQEDTPVGEWEQPGSTNPYMIGDRVMHNGKLWECTVDNNVWEPGVYGWQEV